jgi:HD-GYP domain-containing protein (c-di-GMP phosphodiesterase class II)
MIYRLVNSTYNVRELSLRLTRLLCQFIKASSSTIYIVDPQRKKIILKAIFNNKINILLTKRSELAEISAEEKRVLAGFTVFEKHIIGLPLVGDENIGAVFVHRDKREPAFLEFDKEVLSVVVEQSVTAIKNLQLNEEQQKIILGSIEFIGKLLKKHAQISSKDTSAYFKILQSLGEKLNVTGEGIDNLYYASVLRAAGAIDVPYEILAKTSRLTPDEFKIIRNQPTRCAELIRPVEFLKPVLPIILYHHEHYDGSGYPSGLRREQIPLGARIMAVVDAVEAMTRDRPYKKRLTFSETVLELQRNSGTQFDPKVVDAFLSLCKQKKFRNYLRSIHK